MTFTQVLHPHWKDVLRYQGRTIKWLAAQTGRSESLVYQYSRGHILPSSEWLERASLALGVQVGG